MINICAYNNSSKDTHIHIYTYKRHKGNSSKSVFNNPLLIVNKKSKQKMNKKMEDLNNTVNQIDTTEK